MSFSKTYHIIPSEEERCIWMTAGIISYQLCDRSCDCDCCPLDAAMRNRLREPHRHRDAARNPRESGKAPEGLRQELLYGQNHCWVQPLEGGKVRVGLEPGIGTALLAPRTIVFPCVRQRLQQDCACLWIVMEGGILALGAPCNGVVTETNPGLAQQPHRVLLEPYGAWLFELEAEEAALKKAHLMSRDEARECYAKDEHIFANLMTNALQRNSASVGCTMTDGGLRLQNLADLLGPAKYFSIVREAYGP